MVELFGFGGLFLLLDQWSKNLAETHAIERPLGGGRLLRIRCVLNPRLTLGVGSTRIILPLIWFAALVCAIILHSSGAWFQSRVALLGLGLAFGGAAGNLLDMLRRRHVLDFIQLGRWPVFNLADVGILVGLALAFWPKG